MSRSITNRHSNTINNRRRRSNSRRIGCSLSLGNVARLVITAKIPAKSQGPSTTRTSSGRGESQGRKRNLGRRRERPAGNHVRSYSGKSIVDSRSVNAGSRIRIVLHIPRISQRVANNLDRSTSARTDKIKPDPEQLGTTTLLTSTNKDLSNTSDTVNVVNRLGKSKNESANRQVSTTPYQTRLVNNDTTHKVRIILDTNIKTVNRRSRIKNGDNVNSQTAPRTSRRHSGVRRIIFHQGM